MANLQVKYDLDVLVL